MRGGTCGCSGSRSGWTPPSTWPHCSHLHWCPRRRCRRRGCCGRRHWQSSCCPELPATAAVTDLARPLTTASANRLMRLLVGERRRYRRQRTRCWRACCCLRWTGTTSGDPETAAASRIIKFVAADVGLNKSAGRIGERRRRLPPDLRKVLQCQRFLLPLLILRLLQLYKHRLPAPRPLS